MEIVTIFAKSLFSFHYDNESDNEYKRLLDEWTDISFLREFAKQNNEPDIDAFINGIRKNVEDIEDLLDDIYQDNESFERYFEPLSRTGERSLPRQKGKMPRNKLRIYAIKIDSNCFVITGGAIKMSQAMQDHPGTLKELDKLDKAKDFLIEKGVFDDCSFFELIDE